MIEHYINYSYISLKVCTLHDVFKSISLSATVLLEDMVCVYLYILACVTFYYYFSVASCNFISDQCVVMYIIQLCCLIVHSVCVSTILKNWQQLLHDGDAATVSYSIQWSCCHFLCSVETFSDDDDYSRPQTLFMPSFFPIPHFLCLLRKQGKSRGPRPAAAAATDDDDVDDVDDDDFS